MAHNLATTDGRIAMAYAGETPWHGLGQRLSKMADVQEALVAAGLDWEVEMVPTFLADGREVARRALVRSDNGAIVSSVSPTYVPRQNRDAFSILETSCREHGVRIEAAGALGQGERTWMLASMGQEVVIDAPGGPDPIRGYFLVANGHDGRTAHFAKLTPIRVVCQNTLDAATGANNGIGGSSRGNIINIWHTKKSDAMLAQAAALVANLSKTLVETGETFGALAARNMTPNEIEAYIASVFPATEAGKVTEALGQKRENVRQLMQTGRGHELAGDTAWGAYNAIVEYLDHVRPAEAKNGEKKREAAQSAVFGVGITTKNTALDLARRLAYA